MENKDIINGVQADVADENGVSVSLKFSPEEEKEYYLGLKSQLIKLLYLIEDERKGQGSAELYFYGFMYELKNANILCKNKLTKVCVKMYGLYNGSAYKDMEHSEIKRQIFECKGIVDHLAKQLSE